MGLIAAEVFVNGIAALLDRIDGAGLTNLRVLTDDATALLECLQPASLSRVFVLFPDPWPKARHAPRRFVNPATLDLLAAALAPGGELRVASDDVGYIRWSLRHLLDDRRFRWAARRQQDWRQRPADACPTRYEQKAIREDRAPIFLNFRRA